MYYGWTIETSSCGIDEKYFSLLGLGKVAKSGIVKKNGSSLPYYCVDGQIVAIRNFGKSKMSSAKLKKTVESCEIEVVGGPCLFSRSQLGIINLEGNFCSLAVPKERDDATQKGILALKIGKALNLYHELHVLFVEKMINKIKKSTGKELDIKLLVPGIEYMAYIPDSWSEETKEEYWKKIKKGGLEIEKFYKRRLSNLGKLKIIRKQEWDVPLLDDDLPRDVRSYIKSYLDETSNKKLVVAVEDLMDFPLVVRAGKNVPCLIGILGVLNPKDEFLNKEEEIHPYLL